jgi:hypothetical protein
MKLIHVHVITQMFMELMADATLLPTQPLHAPPLPELPISLFLRIVDQPDALQALVCHLLTPYLPLPSILWFMIVIARSVVTDRTLGN